MDKNTISGGKQRVDGVSERETTPEETRSLRKNGEEAQTAIHRKRKRKKNRKLKDRHQHELLGPLKSERKPSLSPPLMPSDLYPPEKLPTKTPLPAPPSMNVRLCKGLNFSNFNFRTNRMKAAIGSLTGPRVRNIEKQLPCVTEFRIDEPRMLIPKQSTRLSQSRRSEQDVRFHVVLPLPSETEL